MDFKAYHDLSLLRSGIGYPEHRWVRVLAVAFVVFGAVAEAQMGPVTGNHAAGRASDTGFGGGVSSTGGYSASVPLDLPAARGGMAVPVGVVYGGSAVGAAGMSWDVPLSYVLRQASFAHVRPKPNRGAFDPLPASYRVVLGGESVVMVRNAADTAWTGRRSGTQLELRAGSGGTMTLLDGGGAAYLFSSQGPTSATPLAGGDLFLLTDVVRLSSNAVHLDYALGTTTLAGGAVAQTINLVSVAYNKSPAVGGCYKNRIELTYDAPSSLPLALSMLNGSYLARLNTLTSIRAEAIASCSNGFVTLRTYNFNYQPDLDTRQPQLKSVTMSGQAGTPESAIVLPVASYSYGSITDPTTGKIAFAKAYETGPAVGGSSYVGIARSTAVATTEPHASADGVFDVRTVEQLVDVNGDGRPDFTSWSTGGPTTTIGLNRPTADGVGTVFGLEPGPDNSELSHATTVGVPQPVTNPWLTGFSTIVDDTLRQLIDLNGDGRLDIVETVLPDTDNWLVHLNVPTPVFPQYSTFIDFKVPVARMRSALLLMGMSFGRVPMARKTTSLGPSESYIDELGKPRTGQPLMTSTQIVLRDVNGDGYPDFVFEAQGLIYALMNTAGVHVVEGGDLFTTTFVLVRNSSCPLDLRKQILGTKNIVGVCGFADVNGDGLIDRVERGVATLGTGMPDSPFGASGTTATVQLPGDLSVTNINTFAGVDHPIVTGGLRDINGDGLPDYVSYALTPAPTGTSRVAMGTGTGFAPFTTVDSPVGLPLSLEENNATTKGLYDLDGDGQPEMLVLNAPSRRWDVYQLKAPSLQQEVGVVASVPQAGRLTMIDNGYGAVTRIGYKSAKEDTLSFHGIPRPEIVVTAIATTTPELSVLGSPPTNAPILTTTHYAYRGAQMTFDPALDGFVFAGYQRTIEMHESNQGSSPGAALATVTETYGLTPLVAGMDAQARFQRYLQVGHAKDVTTLSGNFGTNPWVLDLNGLATSAARLSGAHYEWDARLLNEALPSPASNERCVDMDPYEIAKPQTIRSAPSEDECTKRGFLFSKSSTSWRGAPGAGDPMTSTSVVRSGSVVKSVDDFGRITAIAQLNDLTRTDDDVCVLTSYAVPAGTNQRVLSAPATVTVTAGGACSSVGAGSTVLQNVTYVYDALAVGSVMRGLVTAAIVSRRDAETGAALGSDIRVFDTAYDLETEMPTSTTTTREDGATKLVRYTYDPFGIVQTAVRTDATGADGKALAPQQVSTARDPLTLAPTYVTETNGMQVVYSYDGFTRQVTTSVTPPVGPAGVLSATSYLNFAVGATGERRIETKRFTDPVPASDVSSRPGRISTVYLDSLGRQSLADVDLGPDYPYVGWPPGNQSIRTQWNYDFLGRLSFESEPRALVGGGTAYGTTYFYNDDGSPFCAIRGDQFPERSTFTDERAQRYPTCFNRFFGQNKEFVDIGAPDALLPGSPQEGTFTEVVSDATGRVLERDVVDGTGSITDQVVYSFDALGHLNQMGRVDRAHPQAMSTTRWHFDNLGQTLSLQEPGSATRLNLYDQWGGLTAERWCDSAISSCSAGAFNRAVINRYDALGRLLHSEEQTITGSTVIENPRDFTYDVAVNTLTPAVTPTFVVGRLTKASARTSSITYGYDGYGRLSTRVSTDLTAASANTYVERFEYHADGSLQASHQLLPDNAFKDERVDYTYDSAARVRSVIYNDGVAKTLFAATPGIAPYDELGRIRAATFGATPYAATFGATGRRLPTQVSIGTPGTANYRSIIFAPNPTNASTVIDPFDPVGRERTRRETVGTVVKPSVLNTYDHKGQLATVSPNIGAPSASYFVYDGLGNVVTKKVWNDSFAVTAELHLDYQLADPDRVRAISYSGASPGPDNVRHSDVGEVLSYPAVDGALRTFSYFPGGSVRTIGKGSTSATFDYDPFGALQRLVVDSPTTAEVRHDKHFGDSLEVRDERVNGAVVPVLVRSIAGPGGLLARRHGPSATAPWTFTFGEQRGTRFVTDSAGIVTQDVDYAPFGDATSTGAVVGTQSYENHQWNGGDALSALGLSQLGARIYDPVIGRFLSKDPLLDSSSSLSANPYVFSLNDPVNFSDPTGLCAAEDIKCIKHQRESDGTPGGFGSWDSLGNISGVSIIHGGSSRTPNPAHAKVPQTTPTPSYDGNRLRVIALVSGATAYGRMDNFNFDGVAATGTTPNAFADILLETQAGAAAFNRANREHNEDLEGWRESFAGVGDALYWPGWVGQIIWGPNANREAFGVAPVDTTSFNYIANNIAGQVLLAGAGEFAGGKVPALSRGRSPNPSCFTAGTQVATPSGLQPIEAIRAGDRVRSFDEALCTEPIDPSSCREVTVEMTDPYGYPDVLVATLLRSEEWVNANRAEIGMDIRLDAEELAISGSARVTKVRECHLQPESGCLVTSTVKHLNNDVMRLRFVEAELALEPTSLHRFWSTDRRDWVRAGNLTVGEHLRAESGVVTVASVEAFAGEHQVFNFEVAGAHTYIVSPLGIKTHNSCWDEIAGHALDQGRFPGKTQQWVANYLKTFAEKAAPTVTKAGATIWRRGNQILIRRPGGGAGGTWFEAASKREALEYFEREVQANGGIE
jgi:RHS repeat-associated protein